LLLNHKHSFSTSNCVDPTVVWSHALWKAFPAYLTHLWNSCQCQSPHLSYQCAGMGVPVHIPSVKWLQLMSNQFPIALSARCQDTLSSWSAGVNAIANYLRENAFCSPHGKTQICFLLCTPVKIEYKVLQLSNFISLICMCIVLSLCW
jgi:hypothetical protein